MVTYENVPQNSFVVPALFSGLIDEVLGSYELNKACIPSKIYFDIFCGCQREK